MAPSPPPDRTEKVISLTQVLVRASTMDGVDAGAQDILTKQLEGMGFTCTSIVAAERKNLLALRGDGPEYFGFAGHTDVVPAGGEWLHNPFEGKVVDGVLFGRGVADMKGPVASFMVALSEFLSAEASCDLPIAILIAGDEETEACGTPALLAALAEAGKSLRWCLVGEPTATASVGDCIKVGRRGSLSAAVTVKGVQGHVAYPHLVKNPIHTAALAVARLVATKLDEENGGDGWPASTVQVTSIESGVSGAMNVVPDMAVFRFNVRYRVPHSHATLREKLERVIASTSSEFSFDWLEGSELYDSPDSEFRALVKEGVKSVTGMLPAMTRDGGTSDGRFIAATGTHVVECGPSNATIHKVNESLPVSELCTLVEVYKNILIGVAREW